MRLGALFRPDPARQEAAERIKALVRAELALPERSTVSVNEIECGDPSCPGGVETVILVRGVAAVSHALKLPGPATEVADDQVRAALVADALRRANG